jgi:hypothetical protein
MTTALLGGAIPVLLGAAVIVVLVLRRNAKRKAVETPPGRVVIACNLADSRRGRR